jgi:7,8-dihydro-6-hydroxymethylpterin-pyrophosphokinase
MKNWNRKLTKEQEEKYVAICELTWGCSPIDVDWAIGTNIYKEMEAKLHLPDVSIAKRTFCLFPNLCGFKGVKTKRCSYKGECEFKTKKAK